MDEENKLRNEIKKKLRNEIKKYVPVVMFNPVGSTMFATNKLKLHEIAAYVAYLDSVQKVKTNYISTYELKKPFFQSLYERYGKGF